MRIRVPNNIPTPRRKNETNHCFRRANRLYVLLAPRNLPAPPFFPQPPLPFKYLHPPPSAPSSFLPPLLLFPLLFLLLLPLHRLPLLLKLCFWPFKFRIRIIFHLPSRQVGEKIPLLQMFFEGKTGEIFWPLNSELESQKQLELGNRLFSLLEVLDIRNMEKR